MFDIGWSEILLIAVVAIVVVGPKDLPPMLRAAGKMIAKLRKTAGEFQGQFNEALREAELDGVKESLDELRGLNPMNQIRKTLDPLSAAIAKPASSPVPPPMGQMAQLATDADIEPAKLPESVAPPPEPEPVVAAKPKRAPRKPKPAAPVAAEGDAAVPVVAAAKAAKPRKPAAPKTGAARAKESSVSAEVLPGEPAPAKKPRAARLTAEPVDPVDLAQASAEPITAAAPASGDPIPEERGS